MTSAEIQEKAKALKTAHKIEKVFRLSTTDEEGNEVSAWVKRPDFSIINTYSAMAPSQPIKSMQVLLNTIWLEGDEAIRKDEEHFMSIMPQLNELIQVRQSKLEKF
jgi:hypothetical protein